MSDEASGPFIVVRREVDNRVPVRAGDDVTTYQLMEPWPMGELPPHSGHDMAFVEYVDEVGRQMRERDKSELWGREHQAVYCTCRERRKLASVLLHIPSQRLWVSPQSERAPNPFKRTDQGNGGAWPLHGVAGERPHVGDVATCKGCRQPWLVCSTDRRAFALAVRRHVGYGAKIVD